MFQDDLKFHVYPFAKMLLVMSDITYSKWCRPEIMINGDGCRNQFPTHKNLACIFAAFVPSCSAYYTILFSAIKQQIDPPKLKATPCWNMTGHRH